MKAPDGGEFFFWEGGDFGEVEDGGEGFYAGGVEFFRGGSRCWGWW